MKTILPIKNPLCKNSECENYLHTTTTAIAVIKLASLQTPHLDVKGAFNAFHRISEKVMLSLTAGAETCGAVFFVFADDDEQMDEEIRDALSDIHNVCVSESKVDLMWILEDFMTPKLGFVVGVLVTDETTDQLLEDPIYKRMKSASNIVAFHSLHYRPICEHLRPATMPVLKSVFESCPMVGGIEQHDHGPITEDDDFAESSVDVKDEGME